MTALNNFLQNSTIATSMTIAGTYSLPVNGSDPNSIQTGAFIPMRCNTGYTFAGGQLNITCVGTMWTTFPVCQSNTGVGNPTTAMTTLPSSLATPCMIDQATTFNITNGYTTSSSLTYTATNLATGNGEDVRVPRAPHCRFHRNDSVCLRAWLHAGSVCRRLLYVYEWCMVDETTVFE